MTLWPTLVASALAISAAAGFWGGYQACKGQHARAENVTVQNEQEQKRQAQAKAQALATQGAQQARSDQLRIQGYAAEIQASISSDKDSHGSADCLDADSLRLWNAPADWPAM